VDGKGKPLGKVPYGVKSLYGQPAVSLSRSALFEALADGMRAQGVEIHYEKRLIRITEQDETITAHFEDGTSAGGDYLIGADGLHSLVREHILPEGPKPEYIGMVALGGFTPLAKLQGVTQEEIDSITYTFGTN